MLGRFARSGNVARSLSRQPQVLTAFRSFSTVKFDYMCENLFNDSTMKANTSPDVYEEFHNSVKEGRAMSKDAANSLADTLRVWAMERGAENFAHWASPVRGPNNLLKHDAFIDLDFKTMEPIVKFSGSRMFFNETDGSSFPNGGLRETHCAAAYLSWDRLSPPFVRGDTLYFPSAFISWRGDALDEKTPLLRSQQAINREGSRLMPFLGEAPGTGVICNVGWEQEFFLIDREDYVARPDLVSCGRTLFGAAPSRGQQTDQNYFSRMPLRVKAVLEDLNQELHRLGIASSVYHSEVAPGQFEFSPIFSLVNSAADGNIVSMELLTEIAQKHDMVCLFHEKPFANLNGSGKHSNWGLNVAGTGRNLFVPGKTVDEHKSFMAMVAVMLRAIHRHGDLIRTSVATAGNDHRLGAQEAPPAIMSLYLGEGLGAHCERLARGEGNLEDYGKASGKIIEFGSPNVQPIEGADEDRNRTAPFPFCGNRFEFRAVGSDQNIGFPLTCVQSAVAESMGDMATRLEAGETLDAVIRDFLKENLVAMFNGDGYSSHWQNEDAPSRGLPNLATSVDAYEVFASSKNVDLFSKVNVFQPHEVHARQEILYDKYNQTILMEANCLLDMMETGVLPACAKDLQSYQGTALSGDRSDLYGALSNHTKTLGTILDEYPHDADSSVQARYCVDVIKPVMHEVRVEADQAERLVDQQLWPFPTYHSMLFDFQSEA
uniref:GS catalytic domain-containing protein n=1 Tax=Mucochytrium quahogii TaxID=96639 RepID=A0A7S2WJT6_9STRA|mmetsp:Transcript_18531/g.30216  ORF Transcript_18531/g.30216 Transcript_18531/m.30216 type:complete len:716 (-) Transcript_18531:509-2656(-)|eukprot:CAMPEP_0203763236 /NCGR_PEP_ID=MMETSP0098-20131031/15898_1 /ASSEMBLY_ACC=CAM_ASM_000208 /TAXON_ID=96639 /ORGANISM=" , Strain NY0313808BC1" /LENGTH=715 /DNA_ID=CAMNT_0050657869 /DNA_START=158 /DNA_END=2305 /DNA_ORIENTATION=+